MRSLSNLEAWRERKTAPIGDRRAGALEGAFGIGRSGGDELCKRMSYTNKKKRVYFSLLSGAEDQVWSCVVPWCEPCE